MENRKVSGEDKNMSIKQEYLNCSPEVINAKKRKITKFDLSKSKGKKRSRQTKIKHFIQRML